MEELNIIPEPEKVHPLEYMFVDAETAKEVKRLGFNEPSFAYYFQSATSDKMNFKMVGDNQGYSDWYENFIGEGLRNADMEKYPIGRNKVCYTAPLISQVVDWLEENHGFSIMTYKFADRWQWDVEKTRKSLNCSTGDGFETRLQALNAGVVYALMIIYIDSNMNK